jgi:hypothetical protein
MAGTAAYGFVNGDPMLLLTGWDADGMTIIFLPIYSNIYSINR